MGGCGDCPDRPEYIVLAERRQAAMSAWHSAQAEVVAAANEATSLGTAWPARDKAERLLRAVRAHEAAARAARDADAALHDLLAGRR